MEALKKIPPLFCATAFLVTGLYAEEIDVVLILGNYFSVAVMCETLP